MNGPEIMMSVLADIELQLLRHVSAPPADLPSSISPSLATALLQKSIRRAQVGLALAAAEMLLTDAPDRLWRRLSIIAIEDVGLGDLDAVYLTIAAAANRGRLAKRFGSWRLASMVVSRLATSPKCRGADDLHVVTEDCRQWQVDRLELADASLSELLDVIVGGGAIERRAIAMRYAMGTVKVSDTNALVRRSGQPHEVFDLLCEIAPHTLAEIAPHTLAEIAPHTLAEIAREAFRQTREPFCAFLPLLHQDFDRTNVEVHSDNFPPQTIIRGLPGWTLDKFSREGQAALARLLDSDCATSNWLRLHMPPRERMQALGHALFRVESGLVRDRLTWPVGTRLRQQADLHSWSFPAEDALTLTTLLRGEIDILNRERFHVH